MVLFIMAAASGTGKSTLARRLLAAEPRLRLSVSHTTRRPRPGETEGVEYHFVDRAQFEARIAEGAFAEWAEYAGNLYGTAHAEIARTRDAGGDLLFDVEVVGAAALKRAYPDAVSVFVLPPTMAELERRLRGRGTESEEVVARRLAAARRELGSAETFDHLVVNDDVERAADDLRAILRAAGLRTASRRALLDRLRATV
ncbi:guanylate kinase [Myxococcota bacterium]|nr:guanylate kinase [Myxococcota bacterium]